MASRQTAISVPDRPPLPSRGASRGARAGLLAASAAVAALPLLIGNPFYLHLAVLVCLNIVFVASLGIIARVGQLSLCHGAFAGIGAYASVLAVMRLELPFLAGFLLAGLAAGLTAALLGWVILRLRGVYFVLVTFAFGELFRLLMLDMPTLSGGANGIAGVPPVSLFGLVLDTKASFYPLALAAAAASVIFVVVLMRSPTGRAFDSTAANLPLAEASGIDTHRFQVVAFAIGSMIAGFGGSLLAHYVGYISPETFHFLLSVNFIIMLVVGGRLTWAGPILGAVILTPLPELLRSTLELQHVLYGVALILVLRFMPDGIAGRLGDLRRRWEERSAP
jgi:branched-chain amino acid transport system permease protein